MGRESELASIIITTYYRNHLLPAAIESALRQTYAPVEVLVVDDSGEANANDVVERYDDVTYVPLDANRGLQAARNAGFERSSGRYVQFLDDDDILHEEKLRRQIPLLTDDVGVVYSGLRHHDSGVTVRPDPEMRGNVLAHALAFELWPPSCNGTRLHDRRVLEPLAPFETVRSDDDWMTIELARRTHFDFVDEPLLTLRLDDSSLGSSFDYVEGRWAIVDMYEELYDEFPRDVRRSALSAGYRLQGEITLKKRQWSLAAIRSFLAAAYYNPDDKTKDSLRFLLSCFGRPGVRIGTHLSRWYTK